MVSGCRVEGFGPGAHFAELLGWRGFEGLGRRRVGVEGVEFRVEGAWD